jgi:hypothetical protein
MKPGPRTADSNFLRLCDLVSSDNLVCVTGAGISSKLPQKDDPSKTLPQWPELLETLLSEFRSSLPLEDVQDCKRLLRLDLTVRGKEWPTGRDLILAATIIRAANPTEFDQAFRKSVTNSDGSFSPTHKCIRDLDAAGILTSNYDSAHENAALEIGVTLSSMIPSDESALREALMLRKRPFISKRTARYRPNPNLFLPMHHIGKYS